MVHIDQGFFCDAASQTAGFTHHASSNGITLAYNMGAVSFRSLNHHQLGSIVGQIPDD